MHDPRAFPALGLSYATAPGGASHTADLTYPLVIGTQAGWRDQGSGVRDQGSGVDEHASEINNTQHATRNTQYVAQARAVIRAQDANQVYGMALAFCHLAGRAFDEQDILAATAAVTGLHWAVDDLLAAGARIWYLKRVLSWACGARAADDMLPERLRRRNTTADAPAAEDLPGMLTAFYALRDLDATGRPSAARLRAVGLGGVAATLYGEREEMPQ